MTTWFAASGWLMALAYRDFKILFGWILHQWGLSFKWSYLLDETWSTFMYPGCIWIFQSKWCRWVCVACAPTPLRHLPCILLISSSIQHFLKVPRKLHPLLNNISQRCAQQLLDMLNLWCSILLVLHGNDILLQNIGKLDQLSKFNSYFPDGFVVLINSSCFVGFHHCTKFLM